MLVRVVRGINMDKDEKKNVIEYIESNKALSIGYEEMTEEEKEYYHEKLSNTFGFKNYCLNAETKKLTKELKKYAKELIKNIKYIEE